MTLFHRLRPEPSPLTWGLCGALGLWLGMGNTLIQIPILALLYPAALVLLGRSAPDYSSALRRGWLTGLVGASAALSWIAVPVQEVGGLPWLMAGACSTVIGAYIGLYAGVCSVLARVVRCLPLWRQVVAIGLGWWVLEGLRNWLFSGFPWLSLASAFVIWPSWIQGASVIGAYGLGGLLAGLASLAAIGGYAWWHIRRGVALPTLQNIPDLATPNSPRQAAMAVAAAAIGLGLLAGAGSWRLAAYGPTSADGPALSVIMVQGNINQNQKWNTAYQQRTVRHYMELSVPVEPKSLIIWPETSIPLAYGAHELSQTIRDWAAQERVWLLFGALGMVRKPGGYDLFNRAYLIAPNGLDTGTYEKEHLVPFGEYMPQWLNLPFLLPLLQGIGDFMPGRSVAPLSLTDFGNHASGPDFKPDSLIHASDDRSLALGLLICYETIFPELSRQRVADGAQILINISNDAWFGRSAAPEQHLQLTALRAVEQQRWLARGTNTGISALIDPFGRITARSGLFAAETLRGTVRPSSELTIFFHLFPYLLPAAAILLALSLYACRCPRNNRLRNRP